ncbi:outer membrane beta-barrel protein [Dyadobacter crusticola]|uniref:outer membrane beta-barrel protein n=1 Tax=Dyadobacter crusticola TaxID=292407 RepID=UPI0004E1925E|nr:outer membrane beta-barrel protein [Dyadobacter crusticola]
MKLIYLLLFPFLLQPALAQKTSLSVYLNGGLGSFRGVSAVKTTSIRTGGPFCRCEGSSANSFGAKNAVSYGAGLVLQKQFKSNVLLGLDLGYELLRTKATIEELQLDDMIMQIAGGKSVSYNHFANIFPHAGYQFNVKDDLHIGLSAGADFGIGLDSYHKHTAPDVFKRYYDNTDIIPGLDFRPRLQLEVGSDKLSLTAGYSYGLKNWMGNYDGGNPRAYMDVIRLGVQYRLF